MPGLPQVGAEAVVQNLAGFRSAMNEVNRSLAQATSAARELGNEGSNMSGALSSVAGAGFSVLSSAAIAAAAAIAAVTAAAAALVFQGIQTNATLEQLTIQLDKTVGRGEETLEWVKEISKTTPFTAEQLSSVISMAGAYGFSRDEAMSLALAAGDVQAVMSTTPGVMERVIRAFGQMQARTKVSASEMLQLTELAIPAWDILADGLGVTVAQLQDMVTKGVVPAGKALPILEKAIRDKFGGAMEEQSQTAKGLFDTFKETIQLLTADITTTPFEIVKVVLEDISNAVAGLDLTGITRAISLFSSALFGAFNVLKEGAFAKELLPAIGDALAKLFGSGEKPDFTWIGQITRAINNLSGPLADIITMLSGGDIMGAFGVLTGGNQDAAQFFAGIVTAITVASAVISSFVETLQTTLGPAFQNIFDQLTGILSDFGLNWGDVWEAVKVAIGIVASVIGAILVGLVGIIVGVVSGIASAIGALIAGFRSILPHIMSVVEGVIKTVTGLWFFFEKLFKGDFPGAFQALRVAWDGIWQTFTGIMMAAWTTISATFNVITAFIGGFVDGIIRFFSTLYEKLIGHSIITDMVEGIFGAFNSLVTDGLAIFTKFTDGIFAIASGIVERVIGLFGGIGDGIKNVLSGGVPATGGQPAAAGGTPAAGGAPAGGGEGEQFELLIQRINTLKASFAELMLMVNAQMTMFLSTITLSFSTLTETALTPFTVAMQAISVWITLGAASFEQLARAVVAMNTAFQQFRLNALASMIEFVLGAQAQFDIFGLYLEVQKGNWAKSWLDFVVAMEVQTTTAVNYIIGEFQRLGNNVGGSSLALTTAFSSSMDSVTQQVTNQLEPTLISGGGAFKALAQAAKEAANDVAAETAAICDAVTSAYECATGSPELIIQHPFERFIDFLKDTSPLASSLIGKMVTPLDNISTGAAALTNDLGVLARGSQNALSGLTANGSSIVNNSYEYNLGPVYQRPQDAASMIDDLATMNLLSS